MGQGKKESGIHCMSSANGSDKNIYETTTKDSSYTLCRRGHGCYKENDQHCGKFSKKGDSNWAEPWRVDRGRSVFWVGCRGARAGKQLNLNTQKVCIEYHYH